MSEPDPRDRPGPIDITEEMETCFGLVEIGREFALQGLMHDGLDRCNAERELERVERRAFARREEPAFSRRFPTAGIWR